jgi:hypothetical protein
MNGSNGSTTITDSELSPKTVNAFGNAQISTAQSYFGGASCLFDGTGDYLTVPTSDDFGFGTGDFTIDCMIRFSSTALQGIIARENNPTGGSTFYMIRKETLGSTFQIRFYVIEAGVTKADYTITTPPSISLNTWYHLAVVRSGTNIYIFKDGVSQTLTVTTAIGTNSISNNGKKLVIGGHYDVSGDFNGNIDELRISKGIARWTSNFTPYTYEYK